MTTKLAFNQIEEALASAKNKGATLDGVTDDKTALVSADNEGVVNVSGTLRAEGMTNNESNNIQNGITSINRNGVITSETLDYPTVISTGETNRPDRVYINGLEITGPNNDSANNWADLSTCTTFSEFSSNTIRDASSGILIGHGDASLGPYSGNMALSTGWEDQPKRATVGAIVSGNNMVDMSWLGIEVFTANHSRLYGNTVHNETPSQQMAYRFTGYPGAPCWFNSMAASTAKNVSDGASIQVSARHNSINGLTVENPTFAGARYLDNPAQPSWHHSNNYIQGCSKDGQYGVYAAKPQYEQMVWNVSGATTFGVEFANAGTYGDNKGNMLDAVVHDSAEGASINSSFNHVRIVMSQLDGRGLTVGGSNNIIDLVCDECSQVTSTVSLQVAGSQNHVRMVASNNSHTTDVSITGNDNIIDMVATKTIAVSGDRNIFRGKLNLTGSTNISDTGVDNDFKGITGGSGMYYYEGTTDGSGLITTVGDTRPGGLGLVAIANVFGTGTEGYTAWLVDSTSANNINWKIINPSGTPVASTFIKMCVQYQSV